MIASWYPSRVIPTNGNFIEKHLQLIAEFTNVVVLHVQKDTTLKWGHFEVDVKEVGAINTYLVYYNSPNWIGKLEMITYKMRAYWKGIKTILKQHSLDLIHVHVMIDAGLIGWLLSKWLNIPMVITAHSTIYQRFAPGKLPYYYRFITKVSGRRAKLIMPVSEALKSQLEAHGAKSSIKVIGNVVDTKVFKGGSKTIEPSSTRFLHISAFKEEQKNISGMLRVVKRLQDENHQFRFTLAGDGDLKLVEDMAQRIGVKTECLTLKGKLLSKEVATLMQENHVFVLFSNYETFSVVAAEAQACGLALITTNLPVFHERIPNEKFGIMVEKADEESLYLAMLAIIQGKYTFDSEEIRNFAYQHYSTEVIGRKILDSYSEILDP